MVKEKLKRYRVVLVEPLYELNVGYIARVMKNFGFTNLYLVAPKFKLSNTCKIFAKHAIDIIERLEIHETLETVLQDVDLVVGTTGIVGSRRNILRTPLTPREFAKLITQCHGNIAILFGREDIGLTNELLSICDVLVTVPANPKYPVLNLSHAVAVILYEIYLQEILHGKRAFSVDLPSKYEREAFLEYILKLLNYIDYPEHKKKKVLLVFRRIIGKNMVTRGELHILMSFFRRIYLRTKRESS